MKSGNVSEPEKNILREAIQDPEHKPSLICNILAVIPSSRFIHEHVAWSMCRNTKGHVSGSNTDAYVRLQVI